ncbi:hypothetical protein NUW54_g1012 [Trametes sanguinea]|uniref:Uncharacterized protein n=1 Tax=Trametes sanguinea TaxID=158606 RepID=A0ACC1Q838_9APHY|nr:hypothetical protein NUW54_g1012 [Trametes sanguinea]
MNLILSESEVLELIHLLSSSDLPKDSILSRLKERLEAEWAVEVQKERPTIQPSTSDSEVTKGVIGGLEDKVSEEADLALAAPGEACNVEQTVITAPVQRGHAVTPQDSAVLQAEEPRRSRRRLHTREHVNEADSDEEEAGVAMANAVVGSRERCPRGGGERLVKRPCVAASTQSVPRTGTAWVEGGLTYPSLDSTAASFLAKLTQGPRCNPLSDECLTWVERYKLLRLSKLVVETHEVDTHPHQESGELSLVQMAERCHCTISLRDALDFVHLCDMMTFTIKVDSVTKMKHCSTDKVWADMTKFRPQIAKCCSSQTFRDWVTFGHKCIALASAGSIYLLMVIASVRASASICALSWQQVEAICYRIRVPHASRERNVIVSRLLPLLRFVAKEIPLKMSTIFPLQLLERYSMPKEFVCSDLELSDHFLDSVNHLIGQSLAPTLASLSDCIVDASQAATLQPCIESSHLPTYDLDLDLQLPFATLDLHDTTHLSTSFNFFAKRNKSQPYPPPGPDREKWMVLERGAAEGAQTISDPAELEDKLKSFYDPDGVKAPGQYLRIDEDIFSHTNLKLTASDGSLLLFVTGDLPDYIREALELQLETALGGDDSNRFLCDIQDWKESGQEFSCLHFAFWSRNATQGHNVLRDLHPMTLKQSMKSHTNHHQMMPYLSKELILNQEVYNNLCNAFEDPFIWLERKLRAQLPEFYSELQIVADVLPGHSSAPAYPFTGFVININVSTKAHRDWGDLSGCLVMLIWCCKGGDLCLEEPGLVVPLRSGDMVVFQSQSMTHFNLQYTGKRASLVCHSDSAGTAWVNDRMRWQGHSYFDDDSCDPSL